MFVGCRSSVALAAERDGFFLEVVEANCWGCFLDVVEYEVFDGPIVGNGRSGSRLSFTDESNTEKEKEKLVSQIK